MVKTHRPATLGLVAAAAASVLISGAVAAQDIGADPEPPVEAPTVVGGTAEIEVVEITPAPPDTYAEMMQALQAERERQVLPQPAPAPRTPTLTVCSGDLPVRRDPCLR